MVTCSAQTRPLRAALSLGGEVAPVTCRRPADHRGQHQGIERVPEYVSPYNNEVRLAYESLTTWGDGGASSSALRTGPELAEACTTCRRAALGLSDYGTPHAPEDHAMVDCVHCGITYHNLGHLRHDQHPDTCEGWCFHCAEWMSRAIRYADPDTGLVRVHDRSPSLRPDRLYGWSKVTGAFGGWHVTVTWDDGRTVGPRDSLWDAGAIPEEWSSYFPPNAIVTPGKKVARAGHTDTAGRPLTYTGHPYEPGS